jgi:hypothetical protein
MQQFHEVLCAWFLDGLDNQAAFAIAGNGGFISGQGKLTRDADRLASSVAEDADGTDLSRGRQCGFPQLRVYAVA